MGFEGIGRSYIENLSDLNTFQKGMDGQSKWLTTDACWDAVLALGKKWTNHQELIRTA